MASLVVQRIWRPSQPKQIDADLAALWRDMAGAVPSTRALLANLVVFRERPQGARADFGQGDPSIEEAVRRHPSRVIVLNHELGRSETCEPLAAMVGVLMFGPPNARYGIEQIAVHSACAEASLPSIVRRLMLGDLPTSLWWTEDLSTVFPIDALVTMSRQLLYDSRQWRNVGNSVLALRRFVDEHHLDLADLNWRRLAQLRRAIGQVVGLAGFAARTIEVQVSHHAGEAALAWLLVGWLDTQLGSGSKMRVKVQELDQPDHPITLTLQDPDGSATTATLTSLSLEVRRAAGPGLVVAVQPESAGDAAASELRSLARDVALHTTLAALIRRFSADRPVAA